MKIISPNQYSKYSVVRKRILTEERIMKSTITKLSSKFCSTMFAVAVLAAYTSASQATTINARNVGFEDPVLGNLERTTTVKGWVATGNGFILNPSNNRNAFDTNVYRSTGDSITQQAGVLRTGTYTLSARVGGRNALPFGTYSVELGILDRDGNFIQVAIAPSPAPENKNSTDIEQRFATSAVAFTALSSNVNLGKPVAIKLTGLTGEVNFDNVNLDFVATPVNVSVYLETQRFDKQLPNGDTVPMWGFATCYDAAFTDCALDKDAPGPQIDAFAGLNLTINVKNSLPSPVSIVIPGQVGSGSPTKMIDASGRERVKSFTHEIAAAGIGTYSWSSLKSGTYLYQSGTNPSLQVPMGLYGALVVHENAAQSYPGISTDSENVLLFSEVDPVQNQRVVDASSTNPVPTVQCISLDTYKNFLTKGYPCTVDYNPVYFFTNGASVADLFQTKGDTVLLRLINAGLRSHTPSIVGLELGLIAEDGNLYPGLPRKQSAVLLAAGKTLDAVTTIPTINTTLSLIDHMPTFVNENKPEGGALGGVQVGSGTPVFVPVQSLAVDDAYNVVEDTALEILAPGVLANDTGLIAASIVSDPSNGSILLNADGSFTYTPNENFSGADSFIYSADGNNAQVVLSVSFVNDNPVANSDGPFVNTIGTNINIAAPGILANDQDVDGDDLTAVLDGTAPDGLTLNADGSFTYTGTVNTTFSYVANDGTNDSAPVTVTITSNPVAGIALTVIDSLSVAVDNYRWTVEEEAMWNPEPGVINPQSLGVNFHKSHMPVVAQGTGAVEFSQLALDPTKHYYVSVLPADAAQGIGHTIGGARILPNANAVKVQVNKTPLPTAQISIFVFEDNSPTNGAVDGNETGLGGFQITLEDAGGRYGVSGGQMSQDVYGNPLKNSLDCFGGATPPEGIIVSCPDTQANRNSGLVGEVLIKDLYQAKYGVITTSPLGDTNKWLQTSTIEGSKVIDAWVKAGEPPYFKEFGPAGPGAWHVFVGFVNPERLAAANPGGANNVTGKITNMHMSRPPNQQLFDSGSYDALAHTKAWVGINSVGGMGPNYAAVQAADDGSFSINGIPDGTYQLVVWDSYLDQVIGYRSLILPDGGNVGNVPIFQWFARAEHNVFLDENQNGKRDAGEGPIPEQAVNLRWRDGTVNQAFPTDSTGFVPFDEVFPFFHWQVMEVDFARFKATGLTTTVDAGGDVTGTGGVLNPQIQADGQTSRTEMGPVLTQGFQGFLGQTSVFDWGKAPYSPGENGGISGIVYYASTRAENNPRLAVGEEWEPGVPSATIRLYREIKRADNTAALVLVAETETDSWDKSLPTGCPGAHADDALITGGPDDKCYDGIRNFNQARPAVFDGGYAFMDIPPGKYIVEVVPPLGFSLVKEESNNVGFGDNYNVAPVPVTLPGGAVIVVPDAAMIAEAQAPEPGLAQPACVGNIRPVGDYLTLFPDELIEAPFAKSLRPLCDRKEVTLVDQGQAAADFFLYTGAPIAGHFVGMVLDDTAQEFNPLSPSYGEKWAPPYVPVSVRDHLGTEISRVYSDQWGRMNGLVPSTFTANMPSPSGYAPAMHMTCMNDPGPIPDPANPGQMIVDPQYNPAYSNFCYTFQYMPGTTTYLDTPVLPVSSFASGYNPPDCALDDTTPMIRQVDGTTRGSSGTGTTNTFGPLVARSGTLTIYSEGSKVVLNPAYTGPTGTEPKTIVRNFDFGSTAGADGRVTIDGTLLAILSWDADKIVATAPSAAMVGELKVTRANGKSTEHSVTVTVSNVRPNSVIRVGPNELYQTIQAGIDAATFRNQLVMVAPGNYQELVIMSKSVRLQGAGAGSTIINGVNRPTEVMDSWRTKMDCLFGIGQGCTQVVNALPNQRAGAAGFNADSGAAITVVAAETGENGFLANNRARIDGFTITGSDNGGGGIYVHSYAHGLEISNNHVFGNSGSYHGGIRIGRPFLELVDDGPYRFNDRVYIHNNSITQNGSLAGAGGGLSIATGSDRYNVNENFICGNFAKGDGGGIGHLGLSNNGQITNNRIVLNQSFDQANTRSGGGVFIGGEPPAAGNATLTKGSGFVTVDGNLIQSNHAAAGHGGGIRTQFVNGRDIANDDRNGQWYRITMTNNMITNNVAGWSGGGISMSDTVRSRVHHNTISNNDATATVGPIVNVNTSDAQPAGISSEPHSPLLKAAIPVRINTSTLRNFSNPNLRNNIIWQNRSFRYDATTGTSQLLPIVTQTTVGECGAGAQYWDLGVLGTNTTYRLNPIRSILTDTTGYHRSNLSGDPSFVDSYCNGGRDVPGSMFPLPALDEGGAAWIDVRFGPLQINGDYHISSASAGLDNGNGSGFVNFDFDNNPRPIGIARDRGADEFAP